jgi:2-oxo-4-hydroxy-4-carboxy-5-ureidoimidazoline decarboxylase
VSESSAHSPVASFDALPPDQAAAMLASCCGSSAWVRGMLARRPFGSMDALCSSADEVWWSLSPADWREAFDHHPRIGERQAAAVQEDRARSWSANEQRGVSSADDATRAALVAGNTEYAQRFGHIYLVCASGRSASELLVMLRERLHNDPATELRIAATEQAKITRLRLAKLFESSSTSRAS